MADDEQFSLCWNNFNTNLSAGFHESLIQGDLVDVTLAAEGQLVKAHRLILSVCSPYFRKMFTQMPANQHAFIFLKDVSHSALKDLIQFMYCGEVNVKQDALPAFISTAEALQIKGLTETGESAPAQQSPAKDTSHHLPSSGVTTIPSSASSPRAKPVQRSRIQSYKIDSDNESEHEKVVQIQATSTSTNASSSSTGPSATIVATQVSTAPQQVQIIQQQQQAQKRTLQQRASITPQTTQIMKRAKLSDPLEAPEPAQIQTVQIVKQITQTPQPTISSEPEYVEMPIETINPKAEPDYVDDPSEVEAIETEHEHEHEHEQALTEHEAAEHEQDADDNYVEDETYGEMAKYDESYFTEGEEVKAGASGFGSESYTDCGTAADQAAQGVMPGVQYVMSTKGSAQLCINGFTFTRHIVKNDTIYWRCTQFRALRCPARHRQRRSAGTLEVVFAKHNHGILERRKRGTLRPFLENRKLLKKQQQEQQLATMKPHDSEETYAAEYLLTELEDFALKTE
ncbi:modifier of mdg4-like isoform X13 [Toxorhynchites rutilus septentrionalis]|uniref:modifier of mdg4-like isoform X13 n=1 Tax=Toxorhynchites rutilus septentrionalis TaxID=329112 RepID=UPI002479F271|nr:modifier of mdg4-like isoform X13 [Toxorhynchites rutilus septentrionalis]